MLEWLIRHGYDLSIIGNIVLATLLAISHLTTSYYAKQVGALKGELEWFRRGPEIIRQERRNT